jgi:4-hydroxybenzoate polyprenyltransferase
MGNNMIIYKVLRLNQAYKQIVVLLPIVATFKALSRDELLRITFAVISYTFAAGFVYIYNDIFDVEEDKKDELKMMRPYAARKITIKKMYFFSLVFLSLAFLLILFLPNKLQLATILSFYLLINLAYSFFHLKHNVVLGLSIVGIGFPLRFLFGSLALDLEPSIWGIILLFELAIFMLCGKRFQSNQLASCQKQLGVNKRTEVNFWLLVNVLMGSLFLTTYVAFAANFENQQNWGKVTLLLAIIPLSLGVIRYIEIVLNPVLGHKKIATEIVVKDLTIIVLAIIFCIVLAIGRLILA